MVTSTVRIPHIVVGDRAYVAIANKLFRSVPLAGVGWGDFQIEATIAGATAITRLAYADGKVLCLCGASVDAQLYDPATRTVAPFSPGVRARVGATYAGQTVWADVNSTEEHVLRLTTGSSAPGPATVAFELDAPIVNMGLHGAELVVATRQSLWFLGGRADPGKPDDPAVAGDQSVAARWTAEPRPFFTQGVWAADDDFLFLLSYGGPLFLEWRLPHGLGASDHRRTTSPLPPGCRNPPRGPPAPRSSGRCSSRSRTGGRGHFARHGL